MDEFYNGRPLGCKAQSNCDSEARVLDVTPIQLLPLGDNLYLLHMDIEYKLHC